MDISSGFYIFNSFRDVCKFAEYLLSNSIAFTQIYLLEGNSCDKDEKIARAVNGLALCSHISASSNQTRYLSSSSKPSTTVAIVNLIIAALVKGF